MFDVPTIIFHGDTHVHGLIGTFRTPPTAFGPGQDIYKREPVNSMKRYQSLSYMEKLAFSAFCPASSLAAYCTVGRRSGIATITNLARRSNHHSQSQFLTTRSREFHSYSINSRPRRLVVAITGATGALFAVRLLELLKQCDIETHLVMSKWASVTLKYETDFTELHIRSLATFNYAARDLAAPISSGSFLHDGMIIVPCSGKTLAAVRMGFSEDLVARAADVTLKEGRKLMLCVRETPLHDIHLENMLVLRRSGAIIFPPMPAFYTKPKSLEDLVNQNVMRMLDSFGIHLDNSTRWSGLQGSKKHVSTS